MGKELNATIAGCYPVVFSGDDAVGKGLVMRLSTAGGIIKTQQAVNLGDIFGTEGEAARSVAAPGHLFGQSTLDRRRVSRAGIYSGPGGRSESPSSIHRPAAAG